MSAAEWTALTVAAIGAMGAVLLQGLQIYLSYRRNITLRAGVDEVSTKLDNNTLITEDARTVAAQVAENLDQKLNGGVDAAIRPLREELATHAAQDEANMRELRGALVELRRRMKQE